MKGKTLTIELNVDVPLTDRQAHALEKGIANLCDKLKIKWGFVNVPHKYKNCPLCEKE